MSSARLRVLQVVPSLQAGGAERMAMHLALGLNSSRFHSEVVSLSDRLGTELELKAEARGATVWYLGKHPGFDARTYWRLHRVLRRFRPDVVHAHLNALLYVMPLALVRRTPAVIYTAHNFPELLIHPRLRGFYRACFRHGAVPVSIIANLTPALCQEFRVSDMPLIRNGIPVEEFRQARQSRDAWRRRAGFGPDDFLFVCAARLSEQKNHQLLLRAFAARPELRERSHLLLAGDGELRRDLQTLASDLNISAQVHFLGVRADVPELLAASDAFVLSSTQEANPLCVLEAMAAGLPVAATSVGGVPGLVTSSVHGLLTEPGQVDPLAQAMCKLLSDAEFRRQCGARAAERALEEFDVSAMARAYEDLYCDCLRRRLEPALAGHRQEERCRKSLSKSRI